MTLSIAGNNPLKLVVQVRHFQSFLMLFFVAIDLVSELLSWKPTGTFIHPPPLSLTYLLPTTVSNYNYNYNITKADEGKTTALLVFQLIS
jgi:hypothetical protein